MTDIPSSTGSYLNGGGPDAAPDRVSSVRQAMREDATRAQAWAEDRYHTAETAIRDAPIRSTLYALGVGVLIGLLISR